MFWVLHGFPLEILFFKLRIFCNFDNNNNREKSLKKILVIIMLVFAFGCEENVTEPSESEYTIVGTWGKLKEITDKRDTIFIYLEFKVDKIIYLTSKIGGQEIERIEGSYIKTGDKITVVDSKFESENGIYSFKINGEMLELILKEDETERRNYFPGIYKRLDEKEL